MKVNEILHAKTIAIKFLEQYNSSVTFRSATLQDDIWIVILDVGIVNNQTRRVLIDKNTGNILSHDSG